MTSRGAVCAICIAPTKGAPMHHVRDALAIAGLGLHGDRYANGEGSWNKGKPGHRQVTLINGLFLQQSGFDPLDTRRNLVAFGVELMDLIGKEFHVGNARLRGVKYCDPCERPSNLINHPVSFKSAFHDRGGLVAEILESGLVQVGSPIVPPPKNY